MTTTTSSLSAVYTGTQYVDEEVLATAPETSGELVFFNLGKYATAREVEDAYKERGLKPAGVLHLAEWVEKHQDDERKFFASQWRDKDGKFCYLTFSWWDGERYVGCNRHGLDWDGRWWFAGVPSSRKPSALKPLDLPAELVINGITYKRV